MSIRLYFKKIRFLEIEKLEQSCGIILQKEDHAVGSEIQKYNYYVVIVKNHMWKKMGSELFDCRGIGIGGEAATESGTDL